MFKKAVAAFAVSLAVASSFAADLYPDGDLRPIKAGDFLQATDTIGGYPIVQNDGNWRFLGGKAYTSNGGSDPIKMGYVQLEYAPTGYLLARQYVSVNTGAGSNSAWGGSPCSPGHLVMRDKGHGKQDNCMTIDAQAVTVGTASVTFLNVALTNSGNSGRYYKVNFGINADLLGFRDTNTGGWTEEQLKANPNKKEAIDRLTAWAAQIQDASIKAFDYSKPTDVYIRMPSFMTLLPVPEDLVGQMRAISFVSAVEHLSHATTIKSIAYARYDDYKGAWGFAVDQPSQAAADAAALAKCESSRAANKPDAPKCEVYRINNGRRLADIYEFKHP
jgi:hypothetical protein